MDYPLVSEGTDRFFDDWGFIVHPEEDPDGGYYGWERWQLNAIKVVTKNSNGDIIKTPKYAAKDHKRMWTVIESGDCGCLWICAGERVVNVVHYMVSTTPWTKIGLEWLDYKCIECQEKESKKDD